MQFVTIDNELAKKEKGTSWLIGMLFVCFWLQWILNEHFVKKLFLSRFSIIQLISHQFLHVHSIHLIINLALLYVFGKIVETRLGIFALYILFLVSGISGGISHLIFSGNLAAGASGAISGLIAAALISETKSRVYFFDQRFYIPVWVMATLWVVKDLIMLAVPSWHSAPAGHLGGFLAGGVCAFLILGFKKLWFS